MRNKKLPSYFFARVLTLIAINELTRIPISLNLVPQMFHEYIQKTLMQAARVQHFELVEEWIELAVKALLLLRLISSKFLENLWRKEYHSNYSYW